MTRLRRSVCGGSARGIGRAGPTRPGAGIGAILPAPLALTLTERNVRRIHAVDEAAAALGLAPGQALADALALAPELATRAADPAADRRALEALADWCERFSPAVAVDAPDGLILDVTGSGAPWGGEEKMLKDLDQRLSAAGASARLACAPTAGAAWALARFASGPGPLQVQAGGLVEQLDPLPLAALRLAAPTLDGLARVGLSRVAQLRKAPRAPLTRRFGPEPLLRLDQALGLAGESHPWRRPPPAFLERLALVEPVSAPEHLAQLARDLCVRLCARLERAGQGARRLLLRFYRVDGNAPGLEAGLGRALRDPERLFRLMAERLGQMDPGFGIEAASLAALSTEPLAARQGLLPGADAGGEPEAADREAADREAANREVIQDLIDRLAARLGEGRVVKPQPRQSWLPERAVGRLGEDGPEPVADLWPEDRPRPVRLFPRPEPVEAAALTPDEPPAMFRWRGRARRVRRAEGPERLAREWWRRPEEEAGPEQVRDYYRVEDESGRRYWLFRAGLHAAEKPARWFIHGLFA